MATNVLETIVKLNSQTQGRDGIIRLLQYTSKFLWWYFERKKLDSHWIVTIKDVEYSLSMGRQLFRLGRCLDTLNAALKSIHLQDLSHRTTITLSKISLALYLVSDHILWFGRVGLMRIDKPKWSKHSNKFWFLSICLGLTRDLYEFVSWIERQKKEKQLKSDKSLMNLILKCFKENRDLSTDILKNCCDFCIPATSLGLLNLPSGLVGLLGVVSSVVGIITLTNPKLKLQPS